MASFTTSNDNGDDAQARLGYACADTALPQAEQKKRIAAALDAGANPSLAAYDEKAGAMGVEKSTCTAGFLLLSKHVPACSKMLELLLDRGADPRKGDVGTADSASKTLLHSACEEDLPAAIKVLLTHRALADPESLLNARDNDGWTPLFFAAIDDHRRAVGALRECAEEVGATLDVDAVATGGSWAGQTALDVALEEEHYRMADILSTDLNALMAKDIKESKKRKERHRLRDIAAAGGESPDRGGGGAAPAEEQSAAQDELVGMLQNGLSFGCTD